MGEIYRMFRLIFDKRDAQIASTSKATTVIDLNVLVTFEVFEIDKLDIFKLAKNMFCIDGSILQ